ncbi:hypothetical protein [Desulfosporosinus fructosivorans]
MSASHVVCSAPPMHVALSQSLVTTRLKDSLTLKRSLWLVGMELGTQGDLALAPLIGSSRTKLVVQLPNESGRVPDKFATTVNGLI